MHPELDYRYFSAQHQALVREAEHEQLIMLARLGPRERLPWRARILSARQNIGFRLVEVGLRLALSPAPRWR